MTRNFSTIQLIIKCQIKEIVLNCVVTNTENFDRIDIRVINKQKNQSRDILIHAEISVYPIGTSSTSASFYIAKAVESIQKIQGIRYEINPMGTILESDSIETIYEAAKRMMEVVHNLGVNRVEVILKVDSRNDKQQKMEEKLDSIKKQMRTD